MSTSNFVLACDEFRYLRGRGYPDKATLKLVADRHRLGRIERNCLFRGIIAAPLARDRRSRIVGSDALAGSALGIDWYNVLITLESYLGGHAVFLCDDGMIRDSAAVHGSYRASALTPRAVSEIAAVLKTAAPSRVDAYVDAPIAWSARMAEDARGALAAACARTDVVLVHSADYPLKKYDGIVASSDSTIMDHAGRIVDLAAMVLWTVFGFSPPPVEQLFP
jgi:hypothetical protein